jgi:branched-chain amino acid aminotransferase
MIVFLNGEYLPEEQVMVSVFDRSFLYGDGIFEAIRLHARKFFRFDAHIQRLQRGADFLKIRMPFSPQELRAYGEELIERNNITEAVLRITLSRGSGLRGYSPRGANHPSIVLALSPLPNGGSASIAHWRLITSSLRVTANDPVAQHKTCSKIHHVLARAEADLAGAEEALLLNSNGDVAETTSGNIFWIDQQVICTTPLAAGILCGITRSIIFQLCEKLGICCDERLIKPATLLQADAAFLTLTSLGVVGIKSLDDTYFRGSDLVSQLHNAYWETIKNETA